MEKISSLVAIKKYFGGNGYPEVTNEEIKKLGLAGVKELAPLCAEALGCEILPIGSK